MACSRHFTHGLGFDAFGDKIMSKMGGRSVGIVEAWWGGYQPETMGDQDLIHIARQFLIEVEKDREFLPLHNRDEAMMSRGF
ncbi:hypothetical protein F5X96DRAFT_648307 [Biscogniauxia mediterranea]|nr:hypothetical protein F5X96DRAFT_648307 [Biscogniauxia mediterranea]